MFLQRFLDRHLSLLGKVLPNFPLVAALLVFYLSLTKVLVPVAESSLLVWRHLRLRDPLSAIPRI